MSDKTLPGKYFLVGDRVCIRQLTLSDAEVIDRLVNSDRWLTFIGTRNVHSPQDAHHYLETYILNHYYAHGYGMFGIVLKSTLALMGMCGLILRDDKESPELGYAILPEYYRNGYVVESAKLVLQYAKERLHMNQIYASVHPDNQASIAILNKLGFTPYGAVQVSSFEIPFYRFYLDL